MANQRENFEFDGVKASYSSMQNITSEIATVLKGANDGVHEYIGVSGGALYGDLGSQLLLDWDNSSSNFDRFVEKFTDWSTIVSQVAGIYDDYANAVKDSLEANPLGLTSYGRTTAYTNDGYFSNSYTREQIDELYSMSQLYDLYDETAATYIDTGMVKYAKRNKVFNIVGDILNVVSIAASGATIVRSALGATGFLSASVNGRGTGASNLQFILGQGKGASSGLTGLQKARAYVGRIADILSPARYARGVEIVAAGNSLRGSGVAIGYGFWNGITTAARNSRNFAIAGVATAGASSITSIIGANYNASNYMTGAYGIKSSGSSMTVNNKDYVYLGTTDQSTELYQGEDGNLYYLDSSQNMKNVTTSSGDNANLENMITENNGSFTVYAGGEEITENSNLSSATDYTSYSENLSSADLRNTSSEYMETKDSRIVAPTMATNTDNVVDSELGINDTAPDSSVETDASNESVIDTSNDVNLNSSNTTDTFNDINFETQTIDNVDYTLIGSTTKSDGTVVKLYSDSEGGIYKINDDGSAEPVNCSPSSDFDNANGINYSEYTLDPNSIYVDGEFTSNFESAFN